MSQMVRAQLIFDRRTPAAGLPAWRDADGDVTPVERDATPVPFAQELAERLQLARDRVEAEQVHLAQVDTVAAAYLGQPQLRLVK